MKQTTTCCRTNTEVQTTPDKLIPDLEPFFKKLRLLNILNVTREDTHTHGELLLSQADNQQHSYFIKHIVLPFKTPYEWTVLSSC